MSEQPSGIGEGPLLVVGIDLAGPANHEDTCLLSLAVEDGRLHYRDHSAGLSDGAILQRVGALAKQLPVVVAVDSPLSYNDGGGDRSSDASLRSALRAKRLPTAMVMAPTAPQMAYLTLRGVAMSRALERLDESVRVVEVHPGASMALRGAPAGALKAYKSDDSAGCRQLAEWLSGQGVLGLPPLEGPSHAIDACAAALTAWHWTRRTPVWLHPANPPLHPFDFAC